MILHITTGNRPLTMNAERKMHRYERNKVMKEWHVATQEALLIARWNKPFEGIEVWARPVYPNKRSFPDTAAITPTVKAIVDQLVRSGVVEDDTPEFHRLEAHMAPIVWREAKYPFVQMFVKQSDKGPQNYPLPEPTTATDMITGVPTVSRK